MTQVILTTSLGAITLELDAARAPKSVENFLAYVADGHYDGTVFHRVIRSFMIQGGGLTSDMRQLPTRAPVDNEADNGLRNDRYTLAMARAPHPHSAAAQFFINTADNASLDHRSQTPMGWGYAVFGRVVDGFDVVDAIEAVPTGKRAGHGDVPLTPVEIVTAAALS